MASVTRDELRRHLGKVGWPVSPTTLVDLARQHGAPESVIEVLNRLPNRVYMSEGDLWGEYQAQLKLTATR